MRYLLNSASPMRRSVPGRGHPYRPSDVSFATLDSIIGNLSAVCLISVLAVLNPLSAQTLAGYLNLSSRQPQPGEVLEVEVVLNLTDQTERLGAYEAHLEWDPEVLEFIEVVDEFAPEFASPQTRAEGGALVFSAFEVEGAGGIVNLLRAKFNVVGSPGESTSMNLTFPVLIAAQTFANLLEPLQILPTTVRIAGESPRKKVVAWLENSAFGEGQRSFEIEIVLDLSGIPDKLNWNPGVLELIEILDGDTPEFAAPQIRENTGELIFSHFNVEGAGERLSLLRAHFAVDEGASEADLALSFTALAAAGDFADLLPLLEIRSDAVSSVTTHSWGSIKSFHIF